MTELFVKLSYWLSMVFSKATPTDLKSVLSLSKSCSLVRSYDSPVPSTCLPLSSY
nr:MAG TPA: hypothetical protein [Caudoviricetes sp.]